jgi:small subunit ribosomal protein S18
MKCQFCQDNINRVDYKNATTLRKFVTSEFRIKASRRTGLCNKHQRIVANAIKISRYMAFMPYTRNQTVKRNAPSVQPIQPAPPAQSTLAIPTETKAPAEPKEDIKEEKKKESKEEKKEN